MRGRLSRLNIWRPVARRYGKKWALLLLGIPIAMIIGGGAYASLLLATGGGSINLQSGLVGWWKMDGNTLDSTIYAQNATSHGSPTLTSDRQGQPNSAYYLNDAHPDYMSVSGSSSRLNGTGPFSYSIWLTRSSSSTYHWPEIMGSTNTHLHYGIRSGNYGDDIYFEYGTSPYAGSTWSSLGFCSGTNLPVGEWHQFTVTYDGSIIRTYLDGSFCSQSSSGISFDPTVGDFGFGGNSAPWNGTMDDARAYNRVLSSDEINALYQSYSPQLNAASGENGLIGRWKMNGNPKDDTPYANNGTINGSPTPTTDREGEANGAYSFNGSTDFLQVGGGGSFFNVDAGQAKTYSIWFKGSTPGATEYFYWQQGNCIGWQFSALTSGYILFGLTTGNNGCTGYNTYSVSTSTSYTDNNWHLATAVVDRPGGNEYLYIDGVLKASHVVDNTYSGVGGTLRIGTNYNNSKPFAGSLADARVYSRALSQSDITHLYDSYNSQINLYHSAGSSGGGADIASGLVGQWNFTGNAKDATPYSDNGTVTGATLTADRFGNSNKAYSFGGTDYITLPNATVLPTATFTYCTWIDPTNVAGGTETIIGPSVAGGPQFRVNGAKLQLVSSSVISIAYSTGTVTQSVWSQACVSYDASGNYAFYINGALSGSGTNLKALTLSGHLLFGAKSTGASELYHGAIDDIRIYNRVLSATDVQALYNLN